MSNDSALTLDAGSRLLNSLLRSSLRVALPVAMLATWVSAQTPVRVFVEESNPWAVQTGDRPQTAEVIKTFRERCPNVMMTTKEDQANFVIKFDREAGKSNFLRRNKIVVSKQNGDVIFADSTRSVGNAVKDACTAIFKSS